MITKGYLLVHSDCTPYEPNETIIAFSENKNELDRIAIVKNQQIDELLNRFRSSLEKIKIYEDKFDNFCGVNNYEISKEKFQEWIKNNPIPENLTDFIKFIENEEYLTKEYNVYFNSVQEHEIEQHYYVQSLWADPNKNSR